MPDIPRPLAWSYLGEVPYQEALALQLALRGAILAGGPGDTLLLLEHPPVITLGRSARRDNVLASRDQLDRLGLELVKIGRGGDVTLHAPGQLVGYPLRRVGRAVKSHVEGMTRAIQALLDEYDIASWWRDDHPGVWTSAGKVAAVGVDARGGVAMHGFALNVEPDLGLYSMIIPCGLQAPVTSMAKILETCPAPDELAPRLASLLAHEYGLEPEEVDARVVNLLAQGYRSPS